MPVRRRYLLYIPLLRLPPLLSVVIRRLMNKLRSASIVRPDVREDGIVRTSNITKFLAACSSYGLPEEDLFQRDDFIDATGESLARVARSIIALLKFVETPAVERSKFIYGQVQNQDGPNLYVQTGTASTPNLTQTPLSISPPPSPVRKRYSPSSGLPTVRSSSPDFSPRTHGTEDEDDEDDDHNILEVNAYPPPPLMTPPPRSPLRARSVKRVDDGGLFTWAKNAASPRRFTDPSRSSAGADSVTDTHIRHSVASAMTDTTMTTEVSSILDFGRSRSTSNGHNKFGTIRTITTDATSEAPSITRTEGSAIADELSRKTGVESGVKPHRDRRISDGPVVDLSRVVEEADESASSGRGVVKDKDKEQGRNKAVEQEKPMNKPRPLAINLRKGKWPDDFIDAFPAQSPTRTITPKSSSPDQDDGSYGSAPAPPTKLAIVGASRHNESLENLAHFPRKPNHRARHSIDTPGLIPKEAVLGRDGSPDGMTTRVMLRQHSTKPGLSTKNGVHFSPGEAQNSDNDSPVPFPQTASGGIGTYHLGGTPTLDDKPRVHRGRFRSDIDSAAWNRVRPNSNDESGASGRRSRIESMVSLGVASNNGSASDLLSRDSRGLPKALILREDGKPPTHFVSFLKSLDMLHSVDWQCLC